MDEKEFWSVIDTAKKNNPTTYNDAREIFENLNFEKTIDFALHFENILDVLDTSTKAYAFAILMERRITSDDTWLYFRSWLIYQGEDIVTKVMNKPDDLLDIYGEYATRKQILGESDREDYLGIWSCLGENIFDEINKATIYGQVTFPDEEFEYREDVTSEYLKNNLPRLQNKFSVKIKGEISEDIWYPTREDSKMTSIIRFLIRQNENFIDFVERKFLD